MIVFAFVLTQLVKNNTLVAIQCRLAELHFNNSKITLVIKLNYCKYYGTLHDTGACISSRKIK